MYSIDRKYPFFNSLNLFESVSLRLKICNNVVVRLVVVPGSLASKVSGSSFSRLVRVGLRDLRRVVAPLNLAFSDRLLSKVEPRLAKRHHKKLKKVSVGVSRLRTEGCSEGNPQK